ncbi:SoxR reducing system RseC family protein [Methylotenera versatilis]|uniref:Positive regulator of sigma E, RseC/MucC n=1 Tax=Methylotenera versatilis (strain 301) TaxID=666681 RepID=D7DJW4_METV0|nr:SoxR reducing system RseC family protein [Methylotenera versatilis]ADI30325.1 positive regulator of sigma E, RseC/MucC [Methylotenera versatilis 301]
MIEEYAIVTKSAGTTATLEIERRTACGLCGQKRGCGNATWGKMLGHDSHDFTAENQINAQVGDSVVVGIDEQAVLNSAFFLYVVPLVGLLIGTLAADYLFKNQFYVILGAVLGLVLGFLWVKGHLIGHDKSGVAFSKKYQAVILRLADDEAGLNHSTLDKT